MLRITANEKQMILDLCAVKLNQQHLNIFSSIMWQRQASHIH